MQGKVAPDSRLRVVETGGGVDASGMPAPKMAYLYNDQTGEIKPVGQQTAAQPLPAGITPVMAKQNAARLVKEGRITQEEASRQLATYGLS